jgi:hypothetical protein
MTVEGSMSGAAASLVSHDHPAPAAGSATAATVWLAHVGTVLRSRSFRFLAATAVAFVVLFARAPGPWVTPLFFAEDREWTSLLVTRGFWHTALHARPDYCVFGNVLVLWTGMRLCDLFDGGDPLELARWQAVASYLAFTVVVSLPVLLLRRRLPAAAVLAVWLLALFMPLGIHSGSWSGFSILGRATNIGFAALFVGFLLVWVRLTPAGPRPLGKILLLDLGLLACIATNPICSVFIPAAAVPLLSHLWKRGARDTRRDALASLASLAVITIAALALNGIPATDRGAAAGMPGAPLDGDRVVEFALARSLLYSVSWPIYAWLDTTRTLLMAAIVGLLLWRCGLPRHRFLYAGGLALLAVTSLTMVCCRAEVGHCLDHYRTTFPDRYFYAQYLVGLPLLAAFTADLSARLAARPWLARLPWAGVFALAALAAWREPAWYVADSQFIVDDDGCFARAAAAAIDRGDFRAADRRPDHRGPFVAIPVHPAFQDAEVLLPRVPVERSVGRHGGTGAARLADRPDRPRR